jgi:hypothetical protein
MKTLFGLAGVCLMALAGCGKKEAAPAKPTNDAVATGNPLTAPVDYLGAVSKAKKVSEKTIDTAYLNQAVQMFNAAEGRYPKDLNELVAEKYLPQMPQAPYNMKIEYDAARGQVKVVPK